MASRFLVATGTWDNASTAIWATTTGGASGAAAPTAADDVFMDANSSAFTCTLAATAVCRSLNCTSFTGTVTHPTAVTLTIGDATAGASNVAFKLVSGMTYTIADITSALNFVTSNTTQQTIDFGGKTIGNVSFNGLANTASWLLSSALTATGAVFTLGRGILNSNGFAVSAASVVASSGSVKTLTFGTSAWTLTGTGTVWNSNNSNLTCNPNTGTVTCSGAGVTVSVNTQSLPVFVFTGSGNAAISVNNSPTFVGITRTGTAVVSDTMTTSGNLTITGTLTITGQSISNRILFSATAVGTAAIVTAAVVSLTNVDFMDITGAGAATWSGSSIGDANGNSGITFATPLSLFGRGGSGSWSTTSLWSTSSGGGAGSTVPLPQDDVTLDANTTGTITMDMPRACKNLTTTNFAGTLTRSIVSSLYGSIAQGAAMTITGGGADWRFDGRGSHTITSNGKTLNPFSMTTSFGGTYTLADAVTITGNTSITVTRGTFSDGGFNVNIGSLISSGAATRGLTMVGSTTWTLTAGNATRWNVTNTGLTIIPGNSIIKLTTAVAGNVTFAGGGLTYNDLWVATASASAQGVITGNNIFRQVIVDPDRILLTTAGSVQTGTPVSLGTSGHLAIFRSATNTSPYTWSNGGATTSIQFASIRDMTWSPATPNLISSNSTNVSGNSNIDFSANVASISGISTLQGISTIQF